MNLAALEDAVTRRIDAAGLAAESGIIRRCCTYLSLLARWNGRINLTALPLVEPIPDSTIDKLIVEPLCAVSLIPAQPSFWIDLGSGGGSPAVPLRLSVPSGSLTMVESRSRKCAFLREAVRALELARTDVVAERFEALIPKRQADLVTIRAVRIDDGLLNLLASWMSSGGILVSFGAPVTDERFLLAERVALPDGSTLQTLCRA